MNPTVVHSIDDPPAFGLGEPPNEPPYLTHTFQVGALGEDCGEPREGTNALSNFPALKHPWKPKDTADSFWLLAELQLYEFPVSRVERFGGWFDALDSVDDDTRGLIELIEFLAGDDSDALGALTDGSLFFASKGHVHPDVRGQHVMLRLIRHALLTVGRSANDVFALLACPIASIFGSNGELIRSSSERVTQNRSARERLARYYSQLGLRRWRSVRRTKDAPILYAAFGIHSLPGLG